MANINGDGDPNVLNDTVDSDSIDGMGGNDTITVTAGSDYVYGGSGNDTLIISWGSYSSSYYNYGGFNVNASGGYDGAYNGGPFVQFTSIENFQITFGSGNDGIVVGNGNDIVNLGSGDDYVDMGAGNDSADGGVGTDGISADLSSVGTNVSWNVQTNSLSGSGGDSFINFEYFGTVTFGNGNDTVVSGLGGYSETLIGGGGDDSLAIFGGSDHLYGGLGTDTAVIRWAEYNNNIYNYGGINANNTLGGYDGAFNGGPYMDYNSVERFDIETGGGNDSIVTGNGNDIVKTNGGDDYVDVGVGADTADGGAGTDGISANLSEYAGGTVWNLLTNSYSGGSDSFTNFEYFGTITTGSGNDVIVSGNVFASETLYAGLGDDSFTTVNGSDTFFAGKGSDRLIIDFSAATGGIYNYGGINANTTDGGFDGAFNGNGLISYNSVEHFTVTTGSGGDSIVTGTGNDVVSTGGSDDYVDVGSGTDSADGGTGKDGISANSGEATGAILWNLQTNSYSGGPDSFTNFEWFGTVTTGSGNDVLVTTNLYDNEVVYTGLGDDSFTTVNGSDTFYAGKGNDTLVIDFAAATGGIYNYGGINANDTDGGFNGAFNGNGLISYASVENFLITTGSGGDNITTANGNDVINLGSNDDYANIGSGIDTADGGDGSDGISADLSDATVAILWNLRTNSYSGGNDSFTNFEWFGTVSTGSGNDRLVTANGGYSEVIYAGQGDDVVTVTNGSDTVFGEKGVDTLIIDFSGATGGIYNYGGINANTVNGGFDGAFNGNGLASYNSIERFEITTGSADDNITTGDGDDIIDGGAANDSLNGGAGFDTLSYASAAAGVTVSLAGPVSQDTIGAGVDTLYNFENLLGSAQADTLTGDARNNIVSGGLGGDLLTGGDGSDALLGGEGTNSLDGGVGNDLLGGSTIVGPDLIVNGGFEMVDLATTSQAFVQAAPNDYNGATYRFTATLLGWQSNGSVELNIAGSNPGFVPGEGKASLDMEVDPGQNRTIYQDVAGIAAGTELLVTFSAALPTGGSLGANPTGVLQVVWNGEVIATVSPTSTVAEQFTFVVNAAAAGSGVAGANRLEFREIGSGADARGTILDDVSLKALAGGSGVDVMTGGTGDDIYLVTAGDSITENADEGIDSVRTALASYTLGANLENLAGTSLTGQTLTGNGLANAITGNAGNDTIDGGGANDVLSGGTGNDTLIGGSGDDSMAGGKGDDVYSGVEAGDTIAENANEGTDEVRTALASFTLATNFENLTGTSAAGQTLTGNGGANVITGAGGNDVIDGGAGIDTMAGGGGNDRYIVDVAGDVVTELAGGGTDTIETALANYSIAALVNVENLTGTANTGQTLTGNTGANVITGGGGNDVIDGGAGSDTMIGGLGDDTYSIDNANDVVTEAANAGTDTIRTNRSALNLLNFVNVENLVGTVNTGQTLTGNTLANTITAGNGNDTLDGGTGNDTLIGGLGNDTYTVDSVGDVVTELAGQGTDTLRTTLASFSLNDVANIENLTGLSAAGQTLTGNAGANTITGAGGNDVIDGGAGIDTMIGGGGNDLYRVDVAGDVVTEGAGAGIDTIETALAAYSLAALANVENLTGTSSSGQTLTGNAAANVITGGSGSDVIDGGTGIDTMVGGLGDDSYAVRDSGDIVTEAADAGADSVTAFIASYMLAENVETLIGGLATGQTLTGNALNNRIVGGAGADTLAGGLGNDVYVVDNAGDAVNEAAGAGTDTVEASVSYALAANVENVTLTGAAAINATGNADANVLIGNSGNNRLDGGAGADSMSGGLGNDTYVVDAGDSVTELLNGGTDTVETAMSYTLGANIENLVLTGTAAINGTGNVLDNVITGTSRANELVGLGGNDRLDGGLGADKMTGGLGDDTYVVDNESDVITELANEGTDTVESSIGFSLAGRNIEILRLVGTAAINGTGSSGADALYGNSANNALNGGLGADRMEGGLGNDRYVVDDAGDVVVEASGGGTDLVTSSITYVLGEFLENLTLSGTAAIDGTGNALANIIAGNAGDNNLDGAAGADTMQGGNGNDHYVVDNAGDKVIEANGQGGDTVDASVSFSLAGQYIEALNLTGTAAINGTGNSLDNRIIGNSAVNNLNGAAGNDRLDGGLGADKLTGGVGNDTYVVDNAGDVITEFNNEGTDTVEASISYSLAGQFIEVLKLTGTANINGTGNGLANTMTGNSGNNTLNGGGGADSLSGGAGNDRYIVDDVNDKVFELTGEGTDVVESSVSFTLAGQFLENLTLIGSGAVDGTGNGLANVLTGNGAANKLNGGAGDDGLHGGLGSDTLTGGLGLDDFWFETTLGAGNVDAITDFKAADDTIHLDRTIFSAILTDGTLSTDAFYQGTAAHDADDRIIYNKVTGQIFYDADGNGTGAAVLFATVTANTTITAADFITHP